MFKSLQWLFYSLTFITFSANGMIRSLPEVFRTKVRIQGPYMQTTSAVQQRVKAIANRILLAKARNYHYQLLESKPWGSTSKKYIEDLKQEDAQLMHEFFTLAGITEQDFVKYKNDWCEHYIKTEEKENEQYPLLPDEHAAKIREALKVAGIDVSRIEMRVRKDERFTAAAGIKTLYINPDSNTFNSHSELDIQTLLHEIMHLIHEDHLTSWVMMSWREANDSVKVKRNHFRERRADILAMLVHHNLADKNAKKYCNSTPKAHELWPPYSDVCDYSCQIHKEMLQALEVSTVKQ